MLKTQWLYNPYVQTLGSILLLIIIVILAQKLFSVTLKRLLSKVISNDGHPSFKYFNNQEFIYWTSYALTPLYLYYGIESIPNIDLKVIVIAQRIFLVLLIFH